MVELAVWVNFGIGMPKLPSHQSTFDSDQDDAGCRLSVSISRKLIQDAYAGMPVLNLEDDTTTKES